MHVVSLQGSPSSPSRSSVLLQHAEGRLRPIALRLDTLALRELPGEALLQARFDDPTLRQALRLVHEAQVVLVATPIYKAAYSGLLKAFLDLLPQDGLRDKTVLPLATGGSPAHLLALDYALKPVLSALGARDILDAVYASDAQVPKNAEGHYQLDSAIAERVDQALRGLIARAADYRREADAARERDEILARLRGPGAGPWPRSGPLRWAV